VTYIEIIRRKKKNGLDQPPYNCLGAQPKWKKRGRKNLNENSREKSSYGTGRPWTQVKEKEKGVGAFNSGTVRFTT